MSTQGTKRAAEDVATASSRRQRPKHSNDPHEQALLQDMADMRREQEEQEALRLRIAAAKLALETKFGWVDGKPRAPQPKKEQDKAATAGRVEEEATPVAKSETAPVGEGATQQLAVRSSLNNEGGSWADQVAAAEAKRDAAKKDLLAAKARHGAATTDGPKKTAAEAKTSVQQGPRGCAPYWILGQCPRTPCPDSHDWTISRGIVHSRQFQRAKATGNVPAHTQAELESDASKQKIARDRQSAPDNVLKIGAAVSASKKGKAKEGEKDEDVQME